MKKDNGATIYILVTVLYHIIAGHQNHMQSTQINNLVGLVTNLKLLCTLKVIDTEIYHRELGIFTRCVIEYEGIGGTKEIQMAVYLRVVVLQLVKIMLSAE
jgi:hypothetical protein